MVFGRLVEFLNRPDSTGVVYGLGHSKPESVMATIASALAVGMIGLILSLVAAGIAGSIGSGLSKVGSLGGSPVNSSNRQMFRRGLGDPALTDCSRPATAMASTGSTSGHQ